MKQQQELIPMATGEFLEQRRLKRKLNLTAVALAINLDEKLLRDIEQEQTDHIAPVYLKGYILTYARYLRIPEDEIKALVASNETKQPAIRNIFAQAPRRNPMDNWLRATSYVLASLLIGTLAWQFTHEAVRLSQNGSGLQNSSVSSGKPEARNNPVQKQEFKGPVNASIAPLGVLHDKETGAIDTGEQAWAAISRPVLPDGEHRLHISVSADSWVEITDADGQELETDLLRGGSDKSYHGKAPFRILFGRASAVRLMMDDKPVDLTGFTRDDVAQLTWPQDIPRDNQQVEQ